MDHYTYEPLYEMKHEIRLLKFKTEATTQASGGAAIQLSLEHASLDDNPEYVALSYAWGDRKDPKEILVNNHRFQVTRNLYFALQVLERERSFDLLWVDAICINQKDDEKGMMEKSWQIQQMGRVFGSAAIVFVWLGNSTPESDMAMQELEEIGSAAIKVGIPSIIGKSAELRELKEKLKDVLRPRASQVVDKDTPAALAVELYNSQTFRGDEMQIALSKLLNRDIWHRAWVFQEIVLANDAYILCGGKRVSVPTFDAGLQMINQCKEALTSVRSTLEDCFPLLTFELINVRGLRVRRQRKLDQNPRLAWLLFYQHKLDSRHFSIAARDPDDLIYSLLGVAGDTVPRKDKDGNDLGPVLTIQVDKRKTPQAVFTEITKSLLKNCEWYRLEYCSFPKNMSSLPTWVPDFEQIAAKGVACNPLSVGNQYRASWDRMQPPFQESANQSSLLREGSRVDVVSSVMESPDWIFSEEEQGYKVRSRARWLEAIQHFALQSPEHVEDVWRAVVADMQHDRSSTRTFRVDENWKKVLGWMLSGVVELTSIDEPWWGIPAEKRTRETALPLRQALTLLSYAEWVGYGRTLFRTKGGRVGLGPSHIETGDIITIIFGTQVPIVLRPVPLERFEFVGEAYVHGTMDGEFKETHPQGETFELV